MAVAAALATVVVVSVSPSTEPSLEDSELVSPGGEDGQELNDGVMVPCADGVCVPLVTVAISVFSGRPANGDDTTGEGGQPCFLETRIKTTINILFLKNKL